MTPSELKYQHESRHPESKYFTRETMKFWGDTMRNYGVMDAGEHWKLYRKRPVKHGYQASALFHKVTFEKASTVLDTTP